MSNLDILLLMASLIIIVLAWALMHVLGQLRTKEKELSYQVSQKNDYFNHWEKTSNEANKLSYKLCKILNIIEEDAEDE